MDINLNLIGSGFKDYTFRSHVLKPTVLLVGALALVLFISIGLVNLFGWRRSIPQVDLVGPGAVLDAVADTPFKYSFGFEDRDHVAPNGDDLVRLPTISIEVMDSIVDDYPCIALRALSKLIFIGDVNHPLFVRLLDNELKPYLVNDGGGVGREWMTRVFAGLKKIGKNDDRSQSFHFQNRKGLLVPQGEWIEDKAIPNREDLKGLDSAGIISFCTEVHFPLFYSIGAVLAYVYFNPLRYVIGPVFHEAIFAAILSLTNNEIDSVYSELSNITKLKMCRALMISHLKSGEEDFAALLPALNFLEKVAAKQEVENQESTNLTDQEIVDMTDFYGSICCDIVEAEDVTSNKFLILEEQPIQNQQFHFVPPKFSLNIPVVRGNIHEFYTICLTRFLNKKEDSLGVIGKTFYPIHMMAKGLRGVLSPMQFGQVRHGMNFINMFTSLITGDTSSEPSQTHVVPDDDLVIEFRDKIQGVLDRNILVEKIVIHTSCNQNIHRKVDWLKEWMTRPETTDKQLSALLIVWGGSSAVDISTESKLNIIPQEVVVGEDGEIIQPLSPTPSGGTCFWDLKISPVDFDGAEGNLADDTQEAFFKVLDTISDGTDNKWTQA